MRLSRQTVSGLALPSGRSELIVFDEALPGFGVRIRAGGKRVWIAQYRMGAKQRRVTIGSVQAIDPDEARRRAKEVLAHAQLGKDPQVDKAEARAKAALTLGSVVERYLDRHAAARLKPKTLADTRRYLRHHWRPLHPLPLHKVERRHAAVYLAEIATSNGPIAAVSSVPLSGGSVQAAANAGMRSASSAATRLRSERAARPTMRRDIGGRGHLTGREL